MILAQLSSILEQGLHIDAKSRFQEIAQEMLGVTPAYNLVEETGPDHDKAFVMGAFVHEELIGKGVGSSKQKAEQEAAKAALKAKKWENIELEIHEPTED